MKQVFAAVTEADAGREEGGEGHTFKEHASAFGASVSHSGDGPQAAAVRPGSRPNPTTAPVLGGHLRA